MNFAVVNLGCKVNRVESDAADVYKRQDGNCAARTERLARPCSPPIKWSR